MTQPLLKKIKELIASGSCNELVKTTVINGKRKKNQGIKSVYIGRPTLWGNPFVNQYVALKYHWKYLGVSTVDPVKAHKEWLEGTNWQDFCKDRRRKVLEKIGELKGKVLRCYCKPQPCHGDYLAELADSTEPKQIEQKSKGDCSECEDAN